MAGWFELSKSSDNQFRFVLKRAMVRLSSPASCIPQKPLRKRASRRCVATARKKNAMRKTASNGKFYFNLKAANHQIIGSSQMYATAQSRETGIASVKANGTSQTVKDNT